MQRRAIDSRWQSEMWEAGGILQDCPGVEPRLLVDRPALSQWLYPGFDIVLRPSEAEGYFHNVSATAPMAFVLWRLERERAIPHFVTLSYDEASRWMDGGAQVDGVPLPAALNAWLRKFVEQNYRPEPKRRIRPASFRAPGERAG